jgi:hypothetical protein
VVTVTATAPTTTGSPRQLAWVDLLRELATEVERGAVYDRHLSAIAAALDGVVRAVRRRGGPTCGPRRGGCRGDTRGDMGRSGLQHRDLDVTPARL